MSILEKISKRIEEKPLPSMVAFEILKVIEDENHSLKQVVKLVENDASLTTEVLKVANSATYFRGMPVNTVNRAVLVLGEMMVVGVAICASSSIVFNSALEGYESPEGDMWEHSLRAAIASREIAKYTKNKVPPGLGFTSGLLHDIGKSVLSEFLIGSTSDLTDACEEGKDCDFLEAERLAVGTDHAEVGYQLAEKWGLPAALKTAIRQHHTPSKADAKHIPLAYTVHLGDLIAMLGGSGTGADALAYKIDNNYENYIRNDKDEFNIILLKVQEDFEIIKESLMT